MNEITKPGIEKLRESLFAALDGLKDGTIDVARAKAMSDISQTIINSAKVEIDFQSQTKRHVRSDFFAAPEALEASKTGTINTKHGYLELNGSSTVHRMK